MYKGTPEKIKKYLKHATCAGVITGLLWMTFSYKPDSFNSFEKGANPSYLSIPKKAHAVEKSEYGKQIAEEMDLEFSEMKREEYSRTLFTLPYKREQWVDSNKQNKLNEKTNHQFEDAVNYLYTVYVARMDLSSIPSILARLFVSEESLADSAEEITRKRAKDRVDMELEKLESEEKDGYHWRKFKGEYDLGNSKFQVRTEIHSWKEDDKAYFIISSYPVENLKESYLELELEKEFASKLNYSIDSL